MLTVHWSIVTPQLLVEAHRHGTAVVGWTVDNPELARRLLALGEDGLNSNDIEMLGALD